MNRPSLLLLAALLLVAGPAAAYDESEASELDSQVVRVWHEPAVPAPGEQWQGWIQFTPEHNVTKVLYQVCNVGVACIAPPTPAMRLNHTTWTYHTADYTDAQGNPAPWGDETLSNGEDWRVGTQFYLTRDDGLRQALPEGIDFSDPACKDRYQECSETHYLAWDMPAGPVGNAGQGAPGLGSIAVLVGLLAVSYPMRNRHQRR